MSNPYPLKRGRKMTVTLYAQPYDMNAHGFYFKNFEDYRSNSSKVRNAFGQVVEEFEIQFIDGCDLYCDFAKAYGVNQANLKQFFEAIEDWDDDQKRNFIIAVGECGYSFDPASVDPDDFDIDIFWLDSLKELAEQFIDEGLFGDIPERLQFYIDYDAIARDLSADYSETVIAGDALIYRCA